MEDRTKPARTARRTNAARRRALDDMARTRAIATIKAALELGVLTVEDITAA